MQATIVVPQNMLVAGGQAPMTGIDTSATVVPLVVQQQQRPRLARGFSSSQQKAMKVLGGLQLAIGLSCIVIGSILVSMKTNTTDDAGAGIWCGAFFGLAGTFALLAAVTNKLGLIITTMVMSILSSLIMWNLVGFASASIDTYNRCSNHRLWYDFSCILNADKYTGLKAADGILDFFAVAELVLSIVCAVLCCQGTCRPCCCEGCCGEAYSYQVHPQVVQYVNAPSAGFGTQQVVILPQRGQYGAMTVGIVQQGYSGGPQSMPVYGQQTYGTQFYGQSNGGGVVSPPSYSALSDARLPTDEDKRYLATTSS